jgi:hypothetical protein
MFVSDDRLSNYCTRGHGFESRTGQTFNKVHERKKQLFETKNISDVSTYLFLCGLGVFCLYVFIFLGTNVPRTLYPRKGSSGVSDIPSRRPRFTKMT